MAKDIINPFTDIPDKDLSPNEAWGSDIINNLKSIQYGGGAYSFKVDDSGLWLGAEKFEDAKTSGVAISMNGTIWASNLIATGYVAIGQTAADINAHSTQVSGTKLIPGTVTADNVVANISITTPSISGGTISGSSITIGSGITQFQANSSGLLLGNPANPSFYVNMSGVLNAKSVIVDGTIIARSASIYNGQIIDQAYIGNLSANKITTGTLDASLVTVTNLNAGSINSGTLNAASINVTNLNANNITTGNYYVGYAGAPAAMYIAQGSDGNAKFYFQGGSRMWSDSSNRIGINSLGSPMYIYVGSSERIIIPNSGQTVIKDGISCQGNFNMTTGSARFSGGVTTEGDVAINNRTSITIGGNTLNLSKSAYFWNTSEFYLSGSTPKVKIGGYEKTAIVKTSKGYKALYCMESPEVWFMDFCHVKRLHPRWMFWEKQFTYNIDPLFRETTVPPYHFMPTMREDIAQVWGRRIGHSHKRFGKKTKEQFMKNEKFYRMAN